MDSKAMKLLSSRLLDVKLAIRHIPIKIQVGWAKLPTETWHRLFSDQLIDLERARTCTTSRKTTNYRKGNKET